MRNYHNILAAMANRIKDMLRIFAVGIVAVGISCGITFAEEAISEKGDPEYRIAVNDILDISVYGEPDLTKTVRVSPEGTITYPLIGNIKAVGLTTQELQNRLTELLMKDYIVNPQVTVFIKEYAKVYVLGQVKNPGAYELKSGLTVIGAIAMAGGLTDIASGNSTKIIRTHKGKKETIQVPIDSILKGGDTSRDIVVQPDDTIVVPESFF